MRVEEYKIVLRNLELHYQEFMRDSQDSQLFDADDRMQIETDYNKATQYYDNLLRSVEKGGCCHSSHHPTPLCFHPVPRMVQWSFSSNKATSRAFLWLSMSKDMHV